MNIQKFLESLFNIDSNTSSTIIITIIVFALGYVFTSLGKSLSEYSLRNANRNLFIKNLETLISSLKKRREILEEQLAHLNIETFTVVPVGKIQFFQISILNSMTHKASFECFFDGIENMFRSNKSKKLRNKAFVKVWENIANIEFWENNMYEQMKPAQEEINRMNETMGKPLKDMRVLYTELLTHLNGPTIQPLERQFLSDLKITVDTWVNQPNREHGHTVNEHLSKRLKLLCNKYETISSARQLRDYCMDASYCYGNIVLINQSLQRALTDYDHSLKYFMRSTKVIIKILD